MVGCVIGRSFFNSRFFLLCKKKIKKDKVHPRYHKKGNVEKLLALYIHSVFHANCALNIKYTHKRLKKYIWVYVELCIDSNCSPLYIIFYLFERNNLKVICFCDRKMQWGRPLKDRFERKR